MLRKATVGFSRNAMYARGGTDFISCMTMIIEDINQINYKYKASIFVLFFTDGVETENSYHKL